MRFDNGWTNDGRKRSSPGYIRGTNRA